MATFSIDKADRERAEQLAEFVKNQLLGWNIEARFVFAIEMSRLLKPETEELKRRAKEVR